MWFIKDKRSLGDSMGQAFGWGLYRHFHQSPQLPSWGGAITPILQMRKLRPTEVKGQIAHQGWNLGSSPELSLFFSVAFTSSAKPVG